MRRATPYRAAALLLLSTTASALDRMNWSPRNYEVLRGFIEDHGRGGDSYEAARPPYAVFDWDQTSAFLDAEESLLHYQVAHLKFKLTPDEFRALLKDEISGVTALSPQSHSIKLADIDADLAEDYAFLHANAKEFSGPLDLEQVRATPQWQDFAAKIGFLYEGYCATPGIGTGYGYPWILFLLANHTVDEVHALAKASIEAGLAEALGSATWKTPADFKSRAGPVDYSFRTGLRVHPEMQDLMESMRSAGIGVYVVTASLKQVVEVFAGPGGFGYNVPADHVIGMEVETAGGKLQPAYKAGWVQTERAGKAEAIRRRLGGLGEPVFAAGDSDGDVEMATEFPGMKLTLILNRVKGGDIGGLCRQAAAQMHQPKPRYILQGRDENTGLFVPMSETIRFGESTAKLLN